MIGTEGLKNWHRYGWSVLVALLFIVVYGYSFNSGDQEEHLPYVYRLLNPTLYPHDYLVPIQIEHFTIRFYFAWLLYFLSQIIPVQYVVFIFYIGCLATTSYCIGRLSELNSKWEGAFYITPIMGLIFLNNFTIGGNGIFDNQLTCSSFSTAFVCLSFLSAQHKRYALAGVFTGAAALFQVLIGILAVPLLIIAIYVIQEQKRIKALILFILFFCICSSPMLFPILIQQNQKIPFENSQLYYTILFNFRNAHHYIPSCFPVKDYIKTITWWILVIFATSIYRNKWDRIMLFLIVLFVSGAIVYYFGFVILNINSIGKLQWFKLSGWITLLGVIPVCAALKNILIIKKSIDALIIKTKKYLFITTFLIVTGLFNSAFLPNEKLNHRYQLGNFKKSNLSKIHQWIAENTPVDCVILPFPNDDSFLCEAKRSIPVGYKAIIHEPFFLLPWYQNFKSIYGVGLDSSNTDQRVLQRAVILYPLRPDSLINSSIKIDFRIWKVSETSPEMLINKQILHREGDFILVSYSK